MRTFATAPERKLPTASEGAPATRAPLLRLDRRRLGRPSQHPPGASVRDSFEAEADNVADAATRMPQPQGGRRSDHPGRVPSSVLAVVEPLLGANLRDVRVRRGEAAASRARDLDARAFTERGEIFLGSDARPTDVGVMAHELTHTVQQRRGAGLTPAVQRQPNSPAPARPTTAPMPPAPAPAATAKSADDGILTAPLTDADWRGIYIWMSRGEVVGQQLTADPEHNADVVTEGVYCSRWIGTEEFKTTRSSAKCVIPGTVLADPRAQELRKMVISRGPIIHWPAVSVDRRLAYVMIGANAGLPPGAEAPAPARP